MKPQLRRDLRDLALFAALTTLLALAMLGVAVVVVPELLWR